MNSNVILEMQNISKSFFGNTVLQNVNFEMHLGEVHALIGANGAGKSTLIKILNGIYSADSGEIYVAGEKASIKHSEDAEKYGIAFVHQELNICPDLNVAENMFIGNLVANKAGIYNPNETVKMAQKLIDMIQIPIKATDVVRSLRAAEKQIIEILKALTRNARILVLDEPTSSLNEKEKQVFFSIIDTLKKKGVSILFISHFLEDVLAISDRVSILKDGTNNGVYQISEVDKEALIYGMMGKTIVERQRSNNCSSECNSVVLELQNLTKSNKYLNISYQFTRGRVVGVCGLLGAGKSEIARSIFGLDSIDSGSIVFEGKKIHNITPEKMIQMGIVFVSEDRKFDGFVPLMSIRENITMSISKKLTMLLGILKNKEQNRLADSLATKMTVRMSSTEQSVASLSGGNQQKVIIGRCIAVEPKVFLLDEPTRGVDVYAKSEIYNTLVEMAERGVCIIVFSSELEELLGVCDEIVVLKKGEIRCTVDPKDTDKGQLLALIS